jgi:hypothetical protein
MKKSVYAVAAILFGISVSYAGEPAINSLKASVSPSVLSETVFPEVSKGAIVEGKTNGVTVNGAISEKTFNLKEGYTLNLKVPVAESAGYQLLPPVFSENGVLEYTGYSAAPPDAVGGIKRKILSFKALKPGKTTITVMEKQSWMPGEGKVIFSAMVYVLDPNMQTLGVRNTELKFARTEKKYLFDCTATKIYDYTYLEESFSTEEYPYVFATEEAADGKSIFIGVSGFSERDGDVIKFLPSAGFKNEITINRSGDMNSTIRIAINTFNSNGLPKRDGTVSITENGRTVKIADMTCK